MINKKKYTIKPLEWFEAENGLILTKDVKPFTFCVLGNYAIGRNPDLILIDTYNNMHSCNTIEEAKRKAQQLWEIELLKILDIALEVEIQIIKHQDEWINNESEISLSIERIYRDTNVMLNNNELIKEIKDFTKNLISEKNTQMSVTDYRKYFYNVIKKKIGNNFGSINASNNNTRLERNR